jgi:LysM domain
MSVLTTGKPSRLTRAAAPARQRAGAVGTYRPVRRGRGAVRHLRVVPDTGLLDGTQTAPESGRPQGAPLVREAGPVTVPSPRRPADVRRPGDVRRPADVHRAGSGQELRHSAGAPDTRLAPHRNTVRLTRRGRLVVTVMLTAVSLSLAVLAWLAIAARGAQAADGGQSPGAVYQNLTSVVVHPGQTLWSIASQAEPTADPRAVMQQIIELNALHGTNVVPGQRLWVPRG